MTTPLTHPAYSNNYRDRTFAIAKTRSANDRAVIENPLGKSDLLRPLFLALCSFLPWSKELII